MSNMMIKNFHGELVPFPTQVSLSSSLSLEAKGFYITLLMLSPEERTIGNVLEYTKEGPNFLRRYMDELEKNNFISTDGNLIKLLDAEEVR